MSMRAVIGAQPFYGHAAAGVVQRRDEPAQHRERVRYRSAVPTAVHGMIERADLYQAVKDPAHRCSQRRPADGPVRAVCEHDGVGSQQVFISIEELAADESIQSPLRPR